ncbi:MAG: ATP-binding protein [Deltaproteobacteria bacterium]|nr:ATP-binding protein [Deltaproteobacteria bacterium]
MLSKDKILEAISDWSYWGKQLPASIPRQGYSEEIARKAASGEILVIKGVRRAGKSTLLLNEIKRLHASGRAARDILLVNLEDPRFVEHLEPALLERIKSSYLEYMNPGPEPVIMLDEVQVVPAWEKWVLKEHSLGRSQLFVTGSSSSLLDPDIGTALSGRYLDLTVFPLSFSEYLRFHDLPIDDPVQRVHRRTEVDRLYRQYAEQGGFPKLVEIPDAETRRDTLKVYYDSILLRDIVARHAIHNPRALEELAVFLLTNTAAVNSTNRLKNTLDMSFDSVRDYTHYLEQACLVFQLARFDWSVKKQLANPRKFYSIDTGLSNRVSFQVGTRMAQNLENIVFLELLRRKHEIYYHKTGQGLEVDFVIKQGARIVELIQVCLDAHDDRTRRREMRALVRAEQELGRGEPVRKTLLTLESSEPRPTDDPDIRVLDAIDWLLFP